jgi:hypothetical protein
MMSIPAAADDDPRPEPSLQPAPDECCGSGCNPCVFDLYDEALERYRVRLEAWMQRHGSAEK